MATSALIVLAMVCLCVQALPNPPVSRNTIFVDEKLEGQIFEKIDTNENIEYNNSPSDYRLPLTTRPTHYNILWTVTMSTFQLQGTVDIDIEATQANVAEIVINSNELTISSVSLRLGTAVIQQTYELQPELQFLRVRPATALQFNATNPIVYRLSINFNAPLRNDMYGIYRSWFRNDQNAPAVNWMASTQFQATSARSAFPCYDEPSFKATFQITIRRPIGFRSWSLTNAVTSPSPTTGFQDDTYAVTPTMSTYLLAIIVADYASITITDGNQLKYEVIARQAAISDGQGSYALSTGEQLVNEMNRHTNIDFFSMHPQIKMTHAAVPDFSAGAMENWGLITYREAYLMYDPANTNDNFKQIIAYILSHEIAHMWFGNLVTCEFWDSLWLNEGFARYYQYFLTSWVETEMGFETRFITEQVHTALLADSSEGAHPLTNPNVGSPQSISAMFSTISYNKGAAIIRMTEHLLGTNVHTNGLRVYLVTREFNVARPIDLFQALQNAATTAGALSQYGNFSLVDYYRSWTEQSGHPVLKVQVNHTTGDMTITQRRFSINGGYANNNLNYIIPITFTSADNVDFDNLKPSHIIRDAVTVINRGSRGDHWVIFNKQQSGFYRVNYDDYTWDLIIMALRGPNRGQINELNRAQIVNDVFQFARSGLMSYSRAFNILSFLENETDYAPWVAAMTGFNWLRNRLAGRQDGLEQRLLEIMSRWSQNVMNRLTYNPLPSDTFMTSYLRLQLAPVLCSINVAACRQAATSQFRALVDNNTPVPVNNRNWVYCNGLRAGTAADYNAMWQRYISVNVYTEKILLLQNLGCTPHRDRLFALLDNIFDENYLVRPQDYSSAYSGAVSGNEGNTQIVFDYIKSNLQKVLNAFGSASPLLTVASRLRTVAEINEFQAWANQNQAALGSYHQSVINSAESTRQSIVWANSVSNDLDNYFQTGDTAVTYSTTNAPPVTQPVTSSRPPLIEPESPDIPDSAVTSVLSLIALMVAVIVNIVV